jgi:hypothetical protein
MRAEVVYLQSMGMQIAKVDSQYRFLEFLPKAGNVRRRVTA